VRVGPVEPRADAPRESAEAQVDRSSTARPMSTPRVVVLQGAVP
jgi:hypothetical protein